MFEIEAIGLDTNGIRGIKPAHDDFVRALNENGEDAIAKLAKAVVSGQLQIEDVEYLIKLTGIGTREKIFLSADNMLMMDIPTVQIEVIRKINHFAARA